MNMSLLPQTVTAGELISPALPILELLALPGNIPFCATTTRGNDVHSPVTLE